MANVNIKFNNKDYLLSCDDGQEENLKELADHLDLKFELEKISKDVGTKFGNKNNFNQKIDELNQETENLIDEIEKWQT